MTNKENERARMWEEMGAHRGELDRQTFAKLWADVGMSFTEIGRRLDRSPTWVSAQIQGDDRVAWEQLRREGRGVRSEDYPAEAYPPRLANLRVESKTRS